MRRWGADDRLPCPECGDGKMLVTRRTIHSTRGKDFEQQTLTCPKCQHERTRTVDGDGKEIAEP